MMDRAALKEAVTTLDVLPTLPVVRERVIAVMDNAQSTIRDVSDAVGADPILTARLLRTVDWHRTIFAGRIPTVYKAVTAVGFQPLRQLVQTQPIFENAALHHEGDDVSALHELWLHSTATAVAARVIATHAGYPDPDECYAAGLLHDLGKFALYEVAPERFYDIIATARHQHTTFYQCEVDSGKPSHAVAGQFLAEHWALPPKVMEVVWRHHTPQLAESFQKIVSIVHIADIFVRALGLGSGGDPFVPPLKPAGLSSVGLRPAQVEAVLNEIEVEYPRAAAPLLVL